MSKRLDIYCDAPKCNQKKETTNNWWVLRLNRGKEFTLLPMHGHEPQDDDYHICGPRCCHEALESFLQSEMSKTKITNYPTEEITIDHNG